MSKDRKKNNSDAWTKLFNTPHGDNRQTITELLKDIHEKRKDGGEDGETIQNIVEGPKIIQ